MRAVLMKIKAALVAVVLAIGMLGVIMAWLPMHQFISKKKLNNSFKNLTLTDLSGYWWRGSIANAYIDHRGYRMPLGDIHWQYDWNTLLSTRWCAAIDNTKVSNVILKRAAIFNSRTCYDWLDRQISMHQVDVEIDSIVVSQLTGLETKGQWLVTISEVEWDYALPSVEIHTLYAEVVWKNAQLHNGEQWISFGEILSTIDFKKPSGFELNTVNIKGPLEIDIKTIVSKRQVTSVIGYIEPYAEINRSLSDSLSLTASRKVGARYYYDYRW